MFINLYMLFSLFHNKLSRAQCSFVCKKGEGLTNRFAHFCNFIIKSVIYLCMIGPGIACKASCKEGAFSSGK